MLRIEKLGAPPWPTLDPFLFCVHHRDAYPAGNGELGPVADLSSRQLGNDFSGREGWSMYHGRVVPGFPRHPHRGFETITVVRRGLIDHSDSLGAAARYGQGDVQWLTAGQGIVHSEMFPLLDANAPNPLELFQIWLNLPSSSKFVEPRFSMLWSDTIPKRAYRDAQKRQTLVTAVAGQIRDLIPPAPPPNSWAARPAGQIAIWTLKLDSNASFELPAADATLRVPNRILYFFAGATLRLSGYDSQSAARARSSVTGRSASREIERGHLAELRATQPVLIENGAADAEILVLQGAPIGEPVVKYGPFVMTTEQEIRQAYADYRRTEFGGWPWPSPGPVHGASDSGRFARHADGRLERANRSSSG
ncbi:MAG TPA: pirin family protein [Polyangiaceae bacterium]|nr:pirin family protein [Polyangiaceae bacterium]